MMLGHVWMKTFDMDGQMKDTKMSDSPSTAVAMTFNSQHQSDKLPDKVVQPCRCHDGWQARGAQAGFKAKQTSLACQGLTPTLGGKKSCLFSYQAKQNGQGQSEKSQRKITLRIKHRNTQRSKLPPVKARIQTAKTNMNMKKCFLLVSFDLYITTSCFHKARGSHSRQGSQVHLALRVQHNKTAFWWLFQAINNTLGNFICKYIWQGCHSLGRSEQEAKPIPLKKTDTILEWSKMSL